MPKQKRLLVILLCSLEFPVGIKREHFHYSRVVYSLLLNKKGGVEADVTVSILDSGTGQLHEPIFKVTRIATLLFFLLCFQDLLVCRENL